VPLRLVHFTLSLYSMSASPASSNASSLAPTLAASGTLAAPPVVGANESGTTQISIPPTISSPGVSECELHCATSACYLSLYELSGDYDFRNHPNVEWGLKFFLSAVVTKVNVDVQQTRGFSATTTAPVYLPSYRIGIVPRGTSARNGSNQSVVSNIPRLVNYSLKMHGSEMSATWGVGGLPFPPGIQLDLKPVEFRTNYASFFIARNSALPIAYDESQDAKGKTVRTPRYAIDDISNLVHVQMEFMVKFTMPGFGIP